MSEYQVRASAVVEGVTHQSGGVLLAGEDRPVAECLADAFTLEPALTVQIVHRGHHRRVRDRTLLRELVEDLSNRGGGTAIPQSVHHDGLELAESAHTTHSSRYRRPQDTTPGEVRSPR